MAGNTFGIGPGNTEGHGTPTNNVPSPAGSAPSGYSGSTGGGWVGAIRRGLTPVPATSIMGYRTTTALSPEMLLQYLTGSMSMDDLVGNNLKANVATSGNASQYGIPYTGPSTSDKTLRGTTVTITDMLASLTKLGKDELIRLQQLLSESGYTKTGADGQPVRMQWGTLDPATTGAYRNLIGDALLHPDKTLTDLIEANGRSNMKDLTEKRNALKEKALAGLDTSVKLTNTDDLLDAAQKAAEKGIGRDLTPDEQRRFVDEFHADQRTQAARSIESKVKAASNLGVTDQQLDSFVNAVSVPPTGPGGLNGLGMTSQEWSRWADRVGLGAGAADNPENEKAVAKEIALNFYAQYGSWSDVATAWYAGPGQHFKEVAQMTAAYHGQSAALTPDINAMVDRTTSAMRSSSSSAMSSTMAQIGSDATENPADPSAAAEMMLKREHPVEYVGHEAASRAADFFNLLGSGPTVNVAKQN